jgi:3-oxoacyl-[acyl-carrier protein] reductase
MDLGLKGARVLVTAASRGLGAATARQFSREGAIVVISSRNLEALQDTAASIVEETGNAVFTQACDVTDETQVQRLIKNTASMIGGIDILVTNAGGPPAGNFDTFDIDVWQSATQLTLLSAVSLIKHSIPYLKQSTRAAILTITSISAKQPVDNLILSNTLRPAVIGLTKSLSLELGVDNIRVNSILPGITDTERIQELAEARATLNNQTIDEAQMAMADGIPLGRIGSPEEFANVAVMMCSTAGGFINGVALPVDGGWIRATL